MNIKTRRIVNTSFLIALIILLSFTPLGYLKVGVFSISFLMIPVTIGAIMYGKLTGALLGFVFGMTSFIQCFGLDAFGTGLFQISPVKTFFVWVITRTLAGFFVGIIKTLLEHAIPNNSVVYYILGAIGAILNTVLTVGSIYFLFGNEEYIKNIIGGEYLLRAFIALAGVNSVLEIAVGSIFIGTITYVIKKVVVKQV